MKSCAAWVPGHRVLKTGPFEQFFRYQRTRIALVKLFKRADKGGGQRSEQIGEMLPKTICS